MIHVAVAVAVHIDGRRLFSKRDMTNTAVVVDTHLLFRRNLSRKMCSAGMSRNRSYIYVDIYLVRFEVLGVSASMRLASEPNRANTCMFTVHRAFLRSFVLVFVPPYHTFRE